MGSRSIRLAVALAAYTLVCSVHQIIAAESIDGAIATSQPTTSPDFAPASQPADEVAADSIPRANYRSRSAGTRIDSDPPDYVRRGPQIAEWFGDSEPDAWKWLDLGIEQRARYEYRDDFHRADQESDALYLLRSRAYLGVREILDPLRFALEFQDSRVFDNSFADTNTDINEYDILQAYAELYLKPDSDKSLPLSLRAGRMSFDLIDRRLQSRNGFRNTTNAFDGFRIRAGNADLPTEINIFAMRPVERRMRHLDRTDEERWVYGLAGAFRQWNPAITLEPYYFVLDDDQKGYRVYDQELHTFGLHAFGLFGDSGFDYDLDVAWQTGKSLRRNQRAFMTHAEVGYTFSHPWKPRLAYMLDYASGDRHPFDDVNERFNRLFGSSHSQYGFNDSFIDENMIHQALRLSALPHKQLRFDALYRVYWLASDSDAWIPADRREVNGRSGDFVGHGFDLMAVYEVNDQLQIEVGYAHLTVGDFIANTGPPADDNDFFYVQTRMRF